MEAVCRGVNVVHYSFYCDTVKSFLGKRSHSAGPDLEQYS